MKSTVQTAVTIFSLSVIPLLTFAQGAPSGTPDGQPGAPSGTPGENPAPVGMVICLIVSKTL